MIGGKKNILQVFFSTFAAIRNVSKINYSFFLLNYNQSLRYFFVTTPCVVPKKCFVIV